MNIVQLNEMKGSPWEPQPGVDTTEIYSKIKIRNMQTDKEVEKFLGYRKECLPRLGNTDSR